MAAVWTGNTTFIISYCASTSLVNIAGGGEEHESRSPGSVVRHCDGEPAADRPGAARAPHPRADRHQIRAGDE